MELSPRITDEIDKLPPELKQLLDAELAAGNEIYSIEFGRGEDKGKVALILNHPFRTKAADAPAGVKYREMRNQDPEVFEYYQDGGLHSLVTAKFKPMKLQPLGPGPENPTQKHIEFMEKRAKEEEAAAKKRAAAAQREEAERARIETQAATRQAAAEEFAPSRNPGLSDAANRFIASMTMTFDMWHDGLGYDLEALAQVSESERKTIESMLIHHQPRDWRDIEALARIDSPAARKIVVAAVHSSDPQVRHEAMHYAAEAVDPNKREALLIKSLENDVIFGGLSQSIDDGGVSSAGRGGCAVSRGAQSRW